MIRVAIVEDDDKDFKTLSDNLLLYFDNDKTKFAVTRYTGGENFLVQYKCNFDLIFMDIELTGMNGMQVCEQLRKIDPVVTIIFVTNMQQFAVKGYEVNALDFIVKPIRTSAFSLKLKRALDIISTRDALKNELTIQSNNKVIRLPYNDLLYVEAVGHYLLYHTAEEAHRVYGAMKEVEKLLFPHGFLKCNRSFLINPYFIDKVDKNNVIMKNGDSLLISAPRKKDFMRELTAFIGKGGAN